jgi:hypothetical protein
MGPIGMRPLRASELKQPLHGDTGIGALCVAYLTSFVNGFVREADVDDTHRFCIGSGTRVGSSNLSPLLRGVVLIGETTLAARDLARAHSAWS